MRKTIGLSRTVRLDWLDAVASMCLENEPTGEIRQRLFAMLEDAQPGERERERIVDTLMRIWVRAEEGLKQQALSIYQEAASREDRLCLHYGLILAQYPFFRSCMSAIGQAARTESQVTRVLIKQRIAQQMGNLGGNERAIERLFVTLEDWGVLSPAEARNTFTIQKGRAAASKPAFEKWLLSCALRAYPSDGLPFDDLIALPELFPFKISIRIDDLRASPEFDVQQQGYMAMVQLSQ